MSKKERIKEEENITIWQQCAQDCLTVPCPINRGKIMQMQCFRRIKKTEKARNRRRKHDAIQQQSIPEKLLLLFLSDCNLSFPGIFRTPVFSRYQEKLEEKRRKERRKKTKKKKKQQRAAVLSYFHCLQEMFNKEKDPE